MCAASVQQATQVTVCEREYDDATSERPPSSEAACCTCARTSCADARCSMFGTQMWPPVYAAAPPSGAPGGGLLHMDPALVGGGAGTYASNESSPVLKLKGLPFAATVEDIASFFAGFALVSARIHTGLDGRPSGMVRARPKLPLARLVELGRLRATHVLGHPRACVCCSRRFACSQRPRRLRARWAETAHTSASASSKFCACPPPRCEHRMPGADYQR
jgi:hypothetical protein